MSSVREHILDGTPEDVIRRYESLGDSAKQMDFGELDRNVVVIDTETTGFSFNHDELIQIAAARLEEGEIADWYITFVNPGKPIPDDIVHLTGITAADVADAPTPQEALAGLVDFAGDAIMVAHNAAFDRTFVTKHPEGYPLLENLWVDSLDLSRIALPRLRSHRLIDLVRTFGAPVSTHRADDDVAATCVIYRILLAGVAAMPRPLVNYIGSMAPRDVWPTGFVFENLAQQMAAGEAQAPPAEEPTAQERPSEESQSTAQAQKTAVFSLRSLRSRRVTSLPARQPRKDADDLVGTLRFPSTEVIETAFSPEGLLGAIYPDYEPRQEQETMALAIRNAFAEGNNLVVEAGTGVGKSMAYLVIAALFARLNDVAVGVATKTNSLLDQLVYQELPALAAALAQEDPDGPALSWAPLKGMSHYPCLRKIGRIVDAGPGIREIAGQEVSQAPALAALLSFIDQSEFDDLDALKIDLRALPRYSITSSPTECLRKKCPYFGKYCFAHGARRRAESADIVVTNHALLFCNVAADGALLPPVRQWIVDEAHSTETEARAAFSQRVSSEALERLVGRVGESAGGRSIFHRAERSAASAEDGMLAQMLRITAKAKSAGSAFEMAARSYLSGVKELLFFDPSPKPKRGQPYETVDIWINDEVRASDHFTDLAALALALVTEADRLIARCQDLVAFLEGIDEAAVAQREVATVALELRELRNAAELIFSTTPETYVYQATLNRKKDRLTDVVEALLLDVGEKMNETFYTQTQSVIYASATLSVGGGFDAFKTAVGLGIGEFSPVEELALESSYDFDNHMMIYVVSDMPEPSEPDYLEALNRLLIAAHRANDGSMLTLFTNRREMEDSHRVVAEALKEDDLRVVCQKWGVSVKRLRDDFVADERLSLFALKSFWEGFDAPGSTLRGVIIPKLPFARPTDPLSRERAARDNRAWWRYVLPQAIIETKQAAGRLIRKTDDRGVLILADKRLVTKGYGETFLKSLQSHSVSVATTDEIVEALKAMDL